MNVRTKNIMSWFIFSIFLTSKSLLSINSIYDLLNDFKKYTTTNPNHSGNPHEHSIWAAKATQVFWDDDSEWCEGLSEKDFACCFLATLLHDVGKCGDLVFIYKIKPQHPIRGFNYLLGKQAYQIDAQQTFDFNQMFEQLGVDDTSRKLITVLVGLHWEFGPVVRDFSTKEPKKNVLLFTRYLKKLEDLARQVGYNQGKVTEKMIKMAILVSAADVRGAQLVYHSEDGPWGIELDNYPASHHIKGTNMYEQYKIETKGLMIRKMLLKYFDSVAHKGINKATFGIAQGSG